MIEKKPENLMSEVEGMKDRHHETRKAAVMGVVLGLIFGLIGGVAGALLAVPWYQENVLRGSLSTSDERSKRIVLDEESAVISAVEEVNPAVVSIVVTKDLPKFEELGSPFGGFFFSVPSGETEKLQVGAGSGFVVTSDGMIVTNKHVVSDEAAEYTVITKDGRKHPAVILATDPFNDLAIVKIEAEDLPVAKLGDSEELRLGQKVIAIGNALGEFQNTVTTGIVSGIGRNIIASGDSATEKLSQVIQTDAAINPGNSGGPLINLSGEVIGVNTAISQSAQLIGFAIPVNQVKKVVSDVREFGKVRRPFLGIRYRLITESFSQQENLSVDYGALILRGDTSRDVAVVPGSAADRAGLREGDIILELDGVKITADNQLADILREYNPGDQVILKILSERQEKTVSVTLGEAQ